MGGCQGRSKQYYYEQQNILMYNLIKPIGKGGFGKVWKIQEKKTLKIYALKVMSKAKVLSKKSVNSIMNERIYLAALYNPFIVNMISAFQDRENVYLLLDYLSGGDLRYYINRKKNFTQIQIKFILQCIVEALDYLHTNKIIHRDIKPQNIIFDHKGYCRITDLGVAREWKKQNANQNSGTPGYMSPQVMLRQNHSYTSDYFAVGVIGYQLVMGKRPYLGKSRKQIRDQILSKQVRISSEVIEVSPQCIDFINRLIQRKYIKRLGHRGIQQIKQHPFIKMDQQTYMKFKNQRLQSPFIPNNIKDNHPNINQISEPNQIELQNLLLLKSDKVQSLFKEYDFKRRQSRDQRQLDSDRLKSSTIKTSTQDTSFFISL